MHTTEGQDFPKASEEKNVRSRKRKEILLQQEVCHCAPKKKKRDKVLNQSKKEYN